MGAGRTDHIAGQIDAVGPSGVREYFTELFAAFPDFALTVRSTVAEDDRTAVHWTATGTHLGPFWGVEPTGARVGSRASTCSRCATACSSRNDAVPDSFSVARQVGLLPRVGSPGRATAVRRLQRQDEDGAAGGRAA